ncbi:hypothetical protein DQ04_02491020 [Trypanosoma grayi]|uniref:hypothetical protein n=1 Tax=Trypanosoma grayi TaxID=71804 RepID=UPI0004F45C7C|nr:hypothetical protein DQ04_02491020 [Trypanosoma grayi]KEG11560.1 hypothetical protein DQ04_02491020 [Trypanosoma grayi]
MRFRLRHAWGIMKRLTVGTVFRETGVAPLRDRNKRYTTPAFCSVCMTPPADAWRLMTFLSSFCVHKVTHSKACTLFATPAREALKRNRSGESGIHCLSLQRFCLAKPIKGFCP